MDWRNYVDRFSQTVKSAYSTVGSTRNENKEKIMSSKPDIDNSWLSKNIIGKIITSGQSSLTQSKNSFVESGRQNSLLRLNSQGETINTEEDLAAFPVISPQLPKEMPPKHHFQDRTTPAGRGWYRPHMGPLPQQFEHGWSNMNYYSGVAYPYQQATFGPRPKMQYAQMPVASGMWTNNATQFSWLPHIPYCIYNVPINSGTTFSRDNVYHFQGNQDCRVPESSNRNYHSYHRRNKQSLRGRSPKRNCNRNSQKEKASFGKFHQPEMPSLHGEQFRIAKDPSLDVIEKMSDLSISSEKMATTSGDTLPKDKKSGSVPASILVADESQEDTKISAVSTEVLVPQTSVDLEDDFFCSTSISSNCDKPKCKSSERLDDALLAFELCGSSSSCKPPVEAKVLTPVIHKKETSPNTRIHTSCITLTPKTSGNKKKKSRPSAKKRRRQKLQRCGEGQIIKVTHHNKKQKTESLDKPQTKSRSDSLSFVIDFSESEISEAETLYGTSPVDTRKSPVKLSLFINAADVATDSDSEDTSSDSNSDSDFFDEDVVDCAGVQHVNSKQASLLSDFDFGLSPVTFKIHYQISNSSSRAETSNSAEDAEDDCNHAMHEDDSGCEIIAAANNRWQNAYGTVPVPACKKTSKVSFAGYPQLVTVHTLHPDEVESYHEARVGRWEEYARDRERFKNRISEVSQAIGYCLEPSHREKIKAKMAL